MAALWVSVPTYGAIVDLTGASSGSLSVRGTDNTTDMQFETIGLPANGTLSLTKPNVTATADYSLSGTGFDVSNVHYSLGAAGGVSSFADLVGQIQFVPKIDVTYTIAGSLNWSGSWANGVSLFARLQDITDANPGTDLALHFYNKTGVLTNASLAVTPGPGRPTTGTLLKGRTYEFDYELAVDNNRFSPDTGTANGALSITFVPEPATCLLIALGGLGLSPRRRRS